MLLLVIAATSSSLVYAADTKTITDMTGRSVTVPVEINTVSGHIPAVN